MLKIHSQASYSLYLLLNLIRSNSTGYVTRLWSLTRAAYTFAGYNTFNPIEINESPLMSSLRQINQFNFNKKHFIWLSSVVNINSITDVFLGFLISFKVFQDYNTETTCASQNQANVMVQPNHFVISTISFCHFSLANTFVNSAPNSEKES